MTRSNYQLYHDYLTNYVIAPFYEQRFFKLKQLNLKKVLIRKNPYLFKAKNIETAGDFVRSVLDAYLSSQEETMFGNLLEKFAIYVSEQLYGGFKSKYKSVDLEFERRNIYYIVGIKSGIAWGNSDQINKMKDNFKSAKQSLRTKLGGDEQIIAVNGCIYGKDNAPLKRDPDPDKEYYRYAGQEFWTFISENDDLYRDIIKPIDEEAKQKDEKFKEAYSAKINEMTEDFMREFVTDHKIDWLKLVDFVSRKN